jgi:hypothetical protein
LRQCLGRGPRNLGLGRVGGDATFGIAAEFWSLLIRLHRSIIRFSGDSILLGKEGKSEKRLA